MTLLIREDTFSEEATRQYMAEMIVAVASVHELGYIHRDLKPDNILLDWDGTSRERYREWDGGEKKAVVVAALSS